PPFIPVGTDTLKYRRRVTISSTCVYYSNEVYRIPAIAGNTISIGNDTFRKGYPFTVYGSAVAVPSGVFSYQWEYYIPGVVGWTNLSGQTSQNLDTILWTDSIFVRRKATTPGCDPLYSQTLK